VSAGFSPLGLLCGGGGGGGNEVDRPLTLELTPGEVREEVLLVLLIGGGGGGDRDFVPLELSGGSVAGRGEWCFTE
jgi:hypothetical protein